MCQSFSRGRETKAQVKPAPLRPRAHTRQNQNPNKGSWTLCDLDSDCATSSELVKNTADALGFKLTSSIGFKLLIERRVS